MRKLIGALGFIYVVSAIVLVPMLVMVLWDMTFKPNVSVASALWLSLKIAVWLIFGLKAIHALQSALRAKLQARVRSVSPENFEPRYELFGLYLTEYIGVDLRQNRVVIVDLKQGIARCESMGFIQGWTIEESGVRTSLVIRFNDFNFSSIKFDIQRRNSEDIAAQLNYAMQFSSSA